MRLLTARKSNYMSHFFKLKMLINSASPVFYGDVSSTKHSKYRNPNTGRDSPSSHPQTLII